MSKGPKGAADFLMPRANSARGKVLGALPRSPARGTPPETPAPFPFAPIFQNGPRRPGFAGENLFNPRKDSPPPRLKRAPWTAAGRSEDLLVTRERGQMQRSTPPQPAVACRLPLAGPDRREMIVVDQTSTGGNHPKQVYRFQDHLVLETLLHFRIILGLEYARVNSGCSQSSDSESPVPMICPPQEPIQGSPLIYESAPILRVRGAFLQCHLFTAGTGKCHI